MRRPTEVYNQATALLTLLFAVGLISSAGVAQAPESPKAPSSAIKLEDSITRDSIRELEAAVAKNPNDSDSWSQLGNLYYGLEQFEQAARALKEAIRLNPKSLADRITFGNSLDYIGDADGAILQYLAAIRLAPDNATAHRNLGVTYMGKGDHKAAAKAFLETVRLSPDYMLARKSAIEALLELDDRDQALKIAREGLHLDRDAALKSFLPDYPPDARQELEKTDEKATAEYIVGMTYKMLQRAKPALDSFARTIRISPCFAQAHVEMSHAFRLMGEFNQAIAAGRKAVECAPMLLAGHLALGVAYMDASRIREGITEFQQAVRVAPESPEAYLLLGIASEEEQSSAAILALEKSLTFSGNTVDAAMSRLNLARLYTSIGAYALAWKHLSLLKDEGDLPELIRSLLGNVESGLKAEFPMSEIAHLDEVIRSLKSRVQEGPEIRMLLSEALDKKGDVAGALEQLEIVESAPSASPETRTKAQRRVIVRLARLGRAQDKIERLEQIVQMKPDDAFILNELAWEYATASDTSLRNPAKALSYAKKAVELTKQSNNAFLDTLAEAYFLNGSTEEAIVSIKQALQLQPDNLYYQGQLARFEDGQEQSKHQ
jgi:tetratricopeptide (TPR) repeat protein